MLKTANILRPALLAGLLFTAGCPVDINETITEPPPGMAECPPAERATVRFFHAAGGTPIIRPDMFSPPINRTLQVIRPDFLVPSPSGMMVPQVVANLAPGNGVVAQVCGNKDLTFAARLSNGGAVRATTTIRLTPDAMPAARDVQTTFVLAGIADSVKPDMTPENPASVADPLKFITVPDTFGTGPETQLIVVHASTRLGPVTVKAESVEATPVAAETAVINRYEVSQPITIKGTSDKEPVAIEVTAVEGTDPKATYTIAPRMPATAKGIAILFDTIIFDPQNTAEDDIPAPAAPVRRLFLTGDDPLLGFVVGGGLTFTGAEP